MSALPGSSGLHVAVKNCSGDGLTTLKRWLGQRDVLVVHDGTADALVLVRWASWSRVIETLVNRGTADGLRRSH